MARTPSLVRLLESGRFPKVNGQGKGEAEAELKRLQLSMLRSQQGIWHQRRRAIILFEGFDAAGKGGTIRRLTEDLDPRGVRVHPIGPPAPDDQGRHYLYRFWARLPLPGTIAVFDRSWYGRVLVERVEGLCPKARWKAAYREINEFEQMLLDDGIDLIKIFLAISSDEQLKRLEDRLNDPYKQWKLTQDDVRSREKWDDYVKAAEEMLERTSSRRAPWHLLPADSKRYARNEALRIVTESLKSHRLWMEERAREQKTARTLKEELRKLGRNGKRT